jgi:hypothetical protein
MVSAPMTKAYVAIRLKASFWIADTDEFAKAAIARFAELHAASQRA